MALVGRAIRPGRTRARLTVAVLRMPSVTHSSGFAVVAIALVAAGSSTLLAQSPAPQAEDPSRPSASAAADENTSRDRRREPPATMGTRLYVYDHGPTKSTKPRLGVASGLFGVEMKCTGCGELDATRIRPDSAHSHAPWALQGKWRRQTPLGVVSTGIVGVRNYGLPLSTAMPIGGDIDPAALGTAGASAFLPGSQWSLTAGLEKTLVKRANGASFGVTGDLLIPVRSETVGVGDPRQTVLASPTMRIGGVLRW
jgi:hypothetical protein